MLMLDDLIKHQLDGAEYRSIILYLHLLEGYLVILILKYKKFYHMVIVKIDFTAISALAFTRLQKKKKWYICFKS
jgi:hypothetical protein